MTLAPIALFVFKRPEHTRRLLESLATNAEFAESPLFVFCDGARNQAEEQDVYRTRKLVHEWDHPNKTIAEEKSNVGLAASIIKGVTRLCSEFGRVVVVEDDLIVSPVFLNYLNTALDRYDGDPRVMQISAHIFPVRIQSDFDAVMLPFTTSWGWATWDRAWQVFDQSMFGYQKLATNKELQVRFDLGGAYPYFHMLQRQQLGQIDSWAIRWYLTVFLNDGFVLAPKYSLVSHDGYGLDATHARSWHRPVSNKVFSRPVSKFPPVQIDEEVVKSISSYFRARRSIIGRIRNVLGIE